MSLSIQLSTLSSLSSWLSALRFPMAAAHVRCGTAHANTPRQLFATFLACSVSLTVATGALLRSLLCKRASCETGTLACLACVKVPTLYFTICFTKTNEVHVHVHLHFDSPDACIGAIDAERCQHHALLMIGGMCGLVRKLQ